MDMVESDPLAAKLSFAQSSPSSREAERADFAKGMRSSRPCQKFIGSAQGEQDVPRTF